MAIIQNSSDALFMAILAMNSYSTDSVGTVIGNATIIKNTALDDAANAAGFYAVAYQLPDGSIVISYRGTDPGVEVADAINGWGVALGSPFGAQAQLAIKFYQQIAQTFPGETISVTGHSLGGGLAGFVGSLFGLNGTLFDSMNYASAANDDHGWRTRRAA